MQFKEICRWTVIFMKAIMARFSAWQKNFIAKVQFENRPTGGTGKKWSMRILKVQFSGGGKRACNGKYASTFLFRSRGTSIPATALNIHAILLTTFQTSLSTGTLFIFLDLCFRSPTLRHVARNGATRRREEFSFAKLNFTRSYCLLDYAAFRCLARHR